MKYILAVDGGNTKTDYLLYDIKGKFIDGKRCSTCSHEGLPDGFDGTYRVMNREINDLLKSNHLTLNDIEAAALGLAGIDCKYQKDKIEEIIRKIGIKKFQVVNDGFLGIKAASPNGTGACSINGTGTVSVSINEKNEWVQIGGIGYIAGDEAGGSYLARTCVRKTFDSLFRFGKKTSLKDDVFKMYDITNEDDLASAILNNKIDSTFLIKSLFKRANEYDEVSLEILKNVGENMALSTAGSIMKNTLQEPIYVILAGSVWAKATNNTMIISFINKVNELTKRKCEYILLKEPPVLGAVYWALEIANEKKLSSNEKQMIKESIQKYQNQF